MTSPEVEAEQLVEDFGFELPIRPREVCATVSTGDSPIEFREEVLNTPNLYGISLCHQGRIEIVVNSTISDMGRRNFTGAHEIGHAICHLQKNRASSFKCTNKDIYGSSQLEFELEANEFASTLLMPRSILGPDIIRNDLSWALVRSIQERCDTSLIATARRIVALSNESCALIVHKDGTMWMPIKSNAFNYFIESANFPKHLNRHPEYVGCDLPDELQECDTIDWISSPKDLPDTILYSAIHNEEFNRTMTLLLIPDHDDENISEWEQPRFRH